MLTLRLTGVLGGNQSKPLKPVLTPPYKTAEAEVVSRYLHPASGEELKFLVVAADGCERSSSFTRSHELTGSMGSDDFRRGGSVAFCSFEPPSRARHPQGNTARATPLPFSFRAPSVPSRDSPGEGGEGSG